MIISRRKIHLFSSIALAILLPIIFVAGLVFRPTYATVTPDTDQLLSQTERRDLGGQAQSPPAGQNPITAFFQP